MNTPRAHKRWTPAELDTLRAEFPNTATAQLATRLGRKPADVATKAGTMGIRKSDEYKSAMAGQRGRESGFQPGHTPWSKSQKGRSLNTGRTHFSKGYGASPEGTQRLRQHYTKSLWEIKADGRWLMLHHHNYTQTHGPIPEGHVVTFLDSNPHNCHPDNLHAISRADLMARNTIQQMPEDLRQVLLTLGTLTRMIKKRTTSNQ